MTTNNSTLRARFESKIERIPIAGCWIWMAASGHHGYGRAYAVLDGKQMNGLLAHRLAWMLYRGQIPKGLNVLHNCDVTSCVNPHHLFVGTQLENIRDMDAKNRCLRKDLTAYNEPRRKLSDADVIEIRESRATQRWLAGRYGVSQPTICKIRNWEVSP